MATNTCITLDIFIYLKVLGMEHGRNHRRTAAGKPVNIQRPNHSPPELRLLANKLIDMRSKLGTKNASSSNRNKSNQYEFNIYGG